MTTILILALLSGPQPDAIGRIPLKIHCGRDWRSKIIRSELSRNHPWFAAKRQVIGERYKIMVDDDENLQPSYQIGSGERMRFAAGAFAASGSFMLTLSSVVECDLWERGSEDGYRNDGVTANGIFLHTTYDSGLIAARLADRPEPFPPEKVPDP